MRNLSAVAAIIIAATIAFACGDDGPQPGIDDTDDFYENIQKVNGRAASDIRRIAEEEEGTARLEAAAPVFEKLAKDAGGFDPAFETVVALDAYIITARTLSEALESAADGDQEATDRLPNLYDDFEFICTDFIDVARTIYSEGRELDCTFPYTLAD